VDQALRLQRAADGADAAVHHVAGRHDVHAGLGLHQRLLAQHGHGLVVEDVAGVVEQAVLAVAGEGVQRHVGQQAQVGEALLQLAHRARHQAVGVGGLAAVGRLQRRVDHREQRHHRHTQLHAVFGHREQAVQAAALHAGHAGHVLHLALAVEHEHRQDQVVGRRRCSRTRARVKASRRRRRGRLAGYGAGGMHVDLLLAGRSRGKGRTCTAGHARASMGRVRNAMRVSTCMARAVDLC
jgi:hypothetical protein